MLKEAEAPMPEANGPVLKVQCLCSTAASKDAARGHALFPLPTIPEFLTTPDVGKHPAFKSLSRALE